MDEEFLFAPVSSMYQDKWYANKGDTPYFYDSSSPALDGVISEERATTGFFQKRIYLLSTMVDYYATLDVENCVLDYVEELNRIRAQSLHEEYRELDVSYITGKLNSLRDCLRMSILVNHEDYYQYFIIDPYKDDQKVLYGGTLDNDGDGYYDVYTDDNGQKKEVIYGDVENRNKAVYNDPVDPQGEIELIDSKGSFFGNSFDAKNRIDAYTFNESSSSEMHIAEEQSYTFEDIDGMDTELLIPCYHGEPVEVVVSVYLEGWDKACINQTMGACFDANISFKLLRRILS